MERKKLDKKSNKQNMLVPWQKPLPPLIKAETFNEILVHTSGFTEIQKNQISQSFQVGAYELTIEYVWKKTIIRLKQQLKSFGPKFLGQMLGRHDITENSNIDQFLTDYYTIELSEALGIINPKGALKLRYANDLINHTFNNSEKHEEDTVDKLETLDLIKTCVQYVLQKEDNEHQLEFTSFRDNLLTSKLSINSTIIKQLVDSPIFYLRTTISVLLDSLKSSKGAHLENILHNILVIIPKIWPRIGEKERYFVAEAYRDIASENNLTKISLMKEVLTQVKGFDYVPENLRSNSFKEAARNLINVHLSSNNFYNEYPNVKNLLDMGTSIPDPAFPDSIQALLSVYIGNEYGHSFDTNDMILEYLKTIESKKWIYIFSDILPNDDILTYKLGQLKPASRLINLYPKIDSLQDLHRKIKIDGRSLYTSVASQKTTLLRNEAKIIYSKIKGINEK